VLGCGDLFNDASDAVENDDWRVGRVERDVEQFRLASHREQLASGVVEQLGDPPPRCSAVAGDAVHHVRDALRVVEIGVEKLDKFAYNEHDKTAEVVSHAQCQHMIPDLAPVSKQSLMKR